MAHQNRIMVMVHTDAGVTMHTLKLDSFGDISLAELKSAVDKEVALRKADLLAGHTAYVPK